MELQDCSLEPRLTMLLVDYPWRFDFCVTPRSKKEIAEYLGMASVSYCIKRYVDPLVEDGALALTEPKSKRSHTQKYFTVK